MDHLGFAVQPGTTTAGAAIAPAVSVNVLDKYGNVETGDNTDHVTLSVASGPGTFTSGNTMTVTVSAGVASFSNVVLDTAGNYSLAENATGGLSGPVSSTFTINPAAPSQLVFSVQPSTTTAGAAIAPSVQVEALDSFGNLATNNNTLPVTLSVASDSGGFTSGSTTTVTVSAGVATFSNLILNTAGSYVLAETATGGLTGPNSAGFTITSAASGYLAFSVQPVNTTAGLAVSPAVQVQVLDKFGNLDMSDNTDQVTLSVASGPGTFTSGSTTTVTFSGGVATFSNLVLDTAGSYSLTESATGGLSGPNSSTFIINPAAPSQLVFSVQPSTTTAGAAIAPAVQVQALDSYGNLATNNSTLQVTLSAASDPGGFTSSSRTTVTVTAGVAAFSNLVLDTAGNYTLAETAMGGLTGPTSGSFTINPAAIDHLGFSVEPGITTAGNAISPAVQVQAFDKYNNLATNDSNDQVKLSIASGPRGSPTVARPP